MNPNKKESVHTESNNPLAEMTSGEVLRYLQDGYDAPVQRTMAAHIHYHNESQTKLVEIKALQAVGQRLLTDSAFKQEGLEADRAFPLEPNLLAAFVDGTLPVDQRNEISNKISKDYFAYKQFANFKREQNTPVAARLRTPARTLESMLVSEKPAHAIDIISRIRNASSWLSEWITFHKPHPAFAVVLAAVFVVWLFAPTQRKKSVLLPPMSAAVDDNLGVVINQFEKTLTFGNGTVEIPEQDEVPVLRIPAQGVTTFKWPTRKNALGYDVSVYDSNGEQIGEMHHFSKPEWKVNMENFASDKPYTILVLAKYADPNVVVPLVSAEFVRVLNS